MKQGTIKIILGIIIVVVGMNFILSAAGIEFNLFFDGWWTLVIMILAVFSIIKNGVKAINLIMLFGGMWLLARAQDWIPSWMSSGYIIGALVIAIGLIFLFTNRRETVIEDEDEPRYRTYARDTDESFEEEEPVHESLRQHEPDHPDYTVIFGSQSVHNTSGSLDGSRCFTLFGELNIDFTDANIDHDVVIDATALFGSVEFRFPRHVQVITKGVPIFGSVDIKRKESVPANAPVVTIRCLVAFGSVEVKS